MTPRQALPTELIASIAPSVYTGGSQGHPLFPGGFVVEYTRYPSDIPSRVPQGASLRHLPRNSSPQYLKGQVYGKTHQSGTSAAFLCHSVDKAVPPTRLYLPKADLSLGRRIALP